jgi:glycosyltransferase involved in cell wall biosynthesis
MISAVILTHNDEKQIVRTLQSLGWCDERIIIDDCSHDKTTAVAKQYDVQIITHALASDFANQRNIGLTQSHGDWVLFVDSDEVVTEKLQKEILKVVKQKEYAGYYIRRIDEMFEKKIVHGESGNIKLLRLARKNAGTWKRRVHETWEVYGSVGMLEEPLLHFPHPDVAQFLDEINMYSTLHARVLHEEKIKAKWWQIAVYPGAKFFVNYILRLGFLDGMAGMIIAMMMSFHSFLARSKLYLLQKNTIHE